MARMYRRLCCDWCARWVSAPAIPRLMRVHSVARGCTVVFPIRRCLPNNCGNSTPSRLSESQMMRLHPIWVLLRADRACWPRLEPVWSCWVSAPIGSHGWMVMARPSVTMVPGGGSADRGSLPRCAPPTGGAAARGGGVGGGGGGWEGALREVQRAFGPIENFSARVASVDSPTALIATFAPSVAGLAREGDAVARRVWAEAGRIVGDAVCAAARRSGLETSFEWSVVGGIAQASDPPL